jgi:hypothetical protein
MVMDAGGRCFLLLTIDHFPLTIFKSEQLCQILSDDIQKLAAVNAARTMLCEFRRQPSVPIARNLACNTASARNVDTTRTGRWCG